MAILPSRNSRLLVIRGNLVRYAAAGAGVIVSFLALTIVLGSLLGFAAILALFPKLAVAAVPGAVLSALAVTLVPSGAGRLGRLAAVTISCTVSYAAFMISAPVVAGPIPSDIRPDYASLSYFPTSAITITGFVFGCFANLGWSRREDGT